MKNIDILARKIQHSVDGTEPPKKPTYLIGAAALSYFDNKDSYEEVLVDPVSIAILSTILVNVFKLWKACHKNSAEALEVAHDPNIFERRALKREIRKEVGSGNEHATLRNKYYNEIRNEGTTLTDSDMEELYDDFDGYATMEYHEGPDTT